MILRITTAGILLALQAAVVPEPRHFRYERELVIVPPHDSGQVCFPLTGSILARTSPSLSDIRIYQAEREIPYALQLHSTVNTAAYAAPVLMNAGIQNGRVVFDARIAHPAYRAITVDVNAHDFVASVVVSGRMSPTDAASTQLGSYTIFDLTSQQSARSTTLQLPLSSFPYLHFEVTGQLKPTDITGITIAEPGAERVVYQSVAEAREITQEGRRTVARVALPRNIPVERIDVALPIGAGNFSRRIELHHAEHPDKKSLHAEGTIFRVHTERNGMLLSREQSVLPVTSTYLTDNADTTHWTVVIDNGDDTPLPIEAFRFMMRERHLCFNGTSDEKYIFRYGDSLVSAPQYDYGKITHVTDSNAIVVLGPEQLNRTFVQRPDLRPWTERHPMIVWGALVFVVLILGGIAFRTAKRMQ